MSTDWDFSFFDGFFLTRPLATSELRQKVDAMLTNLNDMEREYSLLLNAYSEEDAKLTKMETKSQFVQEELEKAITAFEPPAPGKTEELEEYLQTNVYTPLMIADLAFSIPSIVVGIYAWGKMRPHAANLDKMVKGYEKFYRARYGKGASKFGATIGRKKFLARNPKAARAAKVAKWGKRLGTLGLVITAVGIGISIANAKEINAYYKSRQSELKKQISDVKDSMDELSDAITDTQDSIAALLEDAGASTVEDYVVKLNEALGAIGKETAHMGTARRMIIDGMPVAKIPMYVPGMKEAAVAILIKRIEAEKAVLAGLPDAQVIETSGVTAVQLAAIRQVLKLRGALVRGEDVSEMVETSGYSPTLVQGESDRLEIDLKLVWQAAEDQANAAQIAATLMVAESDAVALVKEMQAKAALQSGDNPGQNCNGLRLGSNPCHGMARNLGNGHGGRKRTIVQ